MITAIAGITALIAALGVAVPKIVSVFKKKQADKAACAADAAKVTPKGN